MAHNGIIRLCTGLVTICSFKSFWNTINAIIITIDKYSKILRNKELLTDPSFRFLADLYDIAPKIIITPAIAVSMASFGFAKPATRDNMPKNSAMVDHAYFLIFAPDV